MRFRTGISNVGLLHKIIRSLAALARSCVIKLSEEQVYFIVPGSESATGVQVWSQVKVSTLFEDYRIESNSNNEIWVEVNLDSLVKVLRSADNSVGGINENMRNSAALSQAEVTLKLNKKQNQPIWAFDIKGYTASRKSMIITHEINVKILSSRRQEDLKEPLCPRPDIHVVLPNLQELRNIVSRLAPVADDVDVSANHVCSTSLTLALPSLYFDNAAWVGMTL
ncbi:HUS1 checkpoint protein, variant [Cryptococcus neoformans var. grubii H99]|uniref:Checkpoint protein n=1 Tax=Cryptococcus neoformans (strain H99 / ATCC 208821 / CBS 10515 / FGSC 9487) TaxID=235443 RepID=T2BNI4_CRYN9|nr:HUS1 checkpoint protein, variant [Cryptococcus neoformans var. grubii H99]AGV14263.1 HUS1 checkpoint protein, variant [Cryptococcus neoformans var. grubii H99]AUB24218.1 HUS1 checkpoint protein [Cryptococcus neoformans var. grubii]|eukprot:XP_012048832.1 HUS1 checkpoint protein, variant [Cryptococcus neoformans var. grubii H99]